MSDNPTPLALWRPAEEGEQSWGTLRLLFGGTVAVATASRADLLAALASIKGVRKVYTSYDYYGSLIHEADEEYLRVFDWDKGETTDEIDPSYEGPFLLVPMEAADDTA